MSRQDPEISVSARNLDFFRAVLDHHFFRGHDFKLDSIWHRLWLVVGLRCCLLADHTAVLTTNERRRFSRRCVQFFGRFQNLVQCALHIKRLLGYLVVLAFDDFLEAFDGVRDFYITAGGSRELFGHVKWL